MENNYSLFVAHVCSTRIGVQIDAKFAQFGPNLADKGKGIQKDKIGLHGSHMFTYAHVPDAGC